MLMQNCCALIGYQGASFQDSSLTPCLFQVFAHHGGGIYLRLKSTSLTPCRSEPSFVEWADDLRARIQIEDGCTTAITIIDTGVNYNHPILGMLCNELRILLMVNTNSDPS